MNAAVYLPHVLNPCVPQVVEGSKKWDAHMAFMR